MRVLIVYLFVFLSPGFALAQKYGYSFTNGWRSILLVKQDTGNVVSSLNNEDSIGSSYHFFAQDRFSDDLKLTNTSLFRDKSGKQAMNSQHSSFAVDTINSTLIIGGLYQDSTSDITFGALYEFSGENLKVSKYKFGYGAFVMDLLKHDTQMYMLGVYNNTSAPSERLRAFVATQDSQVNWMYGCEGYQSQGGCELEARQLLKIDDGFLMVGITFSGYEYNLRDPLIIKINEKGEEQWRLDLGNDTTSGFNLVVAPLANGNYLATFSDIYWKPRREPPDRDNRRPVLNEKGTVKCVIFDSDGLITERYDLDQELRFKNLDGIDDLESNHLIQTEDSSIIIVGNTLDNGSNGDYMGFILKLDKNGAYQWYRRLELNINGGGGEERLYINGVTEMDNGSFALAGEYRSEVSDSFPLGIQRGVIILADEFGCIEPGCELKDNVGDLTHKSFTSVYPNPSTGKITVITQLGDPLEIMVYSVSGQLVQSENFRGSVNMELNKGFYILHIINQSSGLYEVKKVLVQ